MGVGVVMWMVVVEGVVGLHSLAAAAMAGSWEPRGVLEYEMNG